MARFFLTEFPAKSELLEWYKTHGTNIVHEVNAHFHTPYSFSAFKELRLVFNMATAENIDILGINDFYTTAGYEEFHELSLEYNKFPLFNIEFVGLMKDEQRKKIKINDPDNPGRTYFSGKGMDYPVSLEGSSLKKLENVRAENQKQAHEMFRRASEHLSSVDPGLELDYESAMKKHTRGMLRERHIAKIIREKIFENYKSDSERRAILKKIYGGEEPNVSIENNAALEDEIRTKLLKANGVAWVEEDSKAFLEIDEVIKIILDAGGIPVYPVLLDDKEGNFTEFEKDFEKLYKELTSRNIYSVELIPERNHYDRLLEFTAFFHDRGFIISFGTEHNTPDMKPLKVSAQGGKSLSDELKRINFEGACLLAAHQYCRAKNEEGYLEKNGKPRLHAKDEMIELGNAVIEYYLQN